MKCPNCGHENRADAKFCDECGTALAQAAPDAAAPDEGRLARLREAVPQALAEKALKAGSKEGERRPVTVLFADVVGSTALAEKRDPEEAKIILEEALSLVMAQVSRYEGLVADLLGDGLLAFFGAPIAHEDDPERATRAALDIQEALSAYGEEIQAAYGVGLQVRVGLNTGPVVVGEMGSDLRMEYTAMGDAVNLASRMESEAPPGGILITEATHRLTERLFTFEPQGKIQVKGREEPVEAYLVTGIIKEPVRTRGIEGLHSPMVGRDKEQALLMEAVENLVSGKGQIVTIMGEAGIGKTRLIQEVRESSSDKDILWLEGRALSYGQSLSLLLFQDLVRSFLEVTDSDSPSMIRVKLKSRVRALFGDREAEIYPYLASLLSLKLEGEMQERISDLHPEALKRRIFVVVGELLERVAQDQPVAVILEDLHWADPTSIELLKGLLPSTDRAPLIILCLFRPERESGAWQIRDLADSEYPHRYVESRLERLPEEESAQLAGNLLAVSDLPKAASSSILEKTQGNPFFLEEVVHALIEEGVLVRQDGEWRATSKILSLEIPDTVQGVIRARIDRLEEEPRQLLQIASVIGKSFHYPVLVQVAQVDGKLDEHLSSLQRLELIEEKARLPEVEYAFKHVLTQEVAYQGLLLDSRRKYHRRVAETIESLFPDRLEEFQGALGLHWSEAGEADKAVEYLIQAGDRARQAYAHEEAEHHYTRALEHLRESGNEGDVAKTLMKLGLTHHISGDYEQVTRFYEEAFERWPSADPSAASEGSLATLRIGNPPVTLNLDPARSSWTFEGRVLDQLFEGLARYDAQGNVVPAAARTWEISSDGTRYQFHLRADRKWSDGRPVTAADFRYAWLRILAHETESPMASNLDALRGAKAFREGRLADPGKVGVKAVDELTLEVNLESPAAYFLQLVTRSETYPQPRWAIEKHGDRWTDPGKMPTNGPYVLAEHAPLERLAIDRNPEYSGFISGNVGRVETIMGDWDELVALYGGEGLDVLWIGGQQLESARSAFPQDVRSVAELGTQFIGFGASVGPCSDLRVRRALGLAVDRREVADRSSGSPTRGGFLPPGMPGHSPEMGLRYDPEEATSLLAAAGFPEGAGLPALRFWIPNIRLDFAQALVSRWEGELGVEIEITSIRAGDRWDKMDGYPPDIHILGWTADYPDPDNFLRAFIHGGSNRTGWRSHEYDEIVAKAGSMRNQVQRMSLYQEADEMLVVDQAILLPVYQDRTVWLQKAHVIGFEVSSLAQYDLRGVIVERP